MRRLLSALLLAASAGAQPRGVPVIFDTDIGNDVDDALALAMLHALESRGEARLIAVTVTKDNPFAAPYIDLVNTYYGRPRIPIGVVRGGKTPEDAPMIRVPVETSTIPHALKSGADAPEATAVLRAALEREADHSVVIVQVGFSTNLARLLDSPGGMALAKRKVKLLAVMGGWFPDGKAEYNIKIDIPSAERVFRDWPGPLVTSGFEVGNTILYPAASIERDFAYDPRHPVAASYRHYKKMPYDRPTWDLTAVLYALRSKSFDRSPEGVIHIDAAGLTRFEKKRGGRRWYLTATDAQRAGALRQMIELAARKPDAARVQ